MTDDRLEPVEVMGRWVGFSDRWQKLGRSPIIADLRQTGIKIAGEMYDQMRDRSDYLENSVVSFPAKARQSSRLSAIRILRVARFRRSPESWINPRASRDRKLSPFLSGRCVRPVPGTPYLTARHSRRAAFPTSHTTISRRLRTSVPGNPNREFFSRLGLPDPPGRACPGRLEREDSRPACTGGLSPPARRPGSFRAFLQVLRRSLPPSPSPRPHPNGARRW
jgi:hypothetical protein